MSEEAAMANDDKPEPSGVLQTAGEASARGHAELELVEDGEHPTMELERVRIQSPSQTPTVRLADLARRPGPRAPEQTRLPGPRAPVALPEGRPVTEAQVIEVDSDLLHDLVQRKVAADARRRAEVRGEEPSAEAPAPVSTAPMSAGPTAKKHGREGALMVAAVLLTALVVVVAATRGPRATGVPPASDGPTETHTAAPVPPSVTPSNVPSTTAAPAPSPPPVPIATAEPAAPPAPSGVPAIKPAGRPRAAAPDPYEDAAVSLPMPKAPAPVPVPQLSPPVLPGGDKNEF